jgi:hypothetical protein
MVRASTISTEQAKNTAPTSTTTPVVTVVANKSDTHLSRDSEDGEKNPH